MFFTPCGERFPRTCFNFNFWFRPLVFEPRCVSDIPILFFCSLICLFYHRRTGYRPKVNILLFMHIKRVLLAVCRNAGAAAAVVEFTRTKPCEAVSIREVSVFVPVLSRSYMHGRISEPGTEPYHPPVALALCASPRRSAFNQ